MGLSEKSPTSPYLVLAAASVGVFMTMLDTTVVYIASPRILEGLGATLDQGLWVIDAYILAFGVLLVTAGRLGEVFGPRRIFVLGLLLFGATSVLAGLSSSVHGLVLMRALQGLAGALIEPQAAVLIVASFPKERIGAALGIFGAILGLSALVGPTLGGFIVTHASWRWIFFLNVPLTAVAVVMARMFAPALEQVRRPRLDVVGTVLLTASLVAIVFTLIEGQRYGWGRVWGPVTVPHVLGAGLFFLAAFVLSQRFVKEPLLPMSLFRKQNLALMVITATGVDFALQGIIVAFSLCFQVALRMTPFEAGLTFAPLAIAGGIAAPIMGRLVDRHGGRYVVGGGLVVFALGIEISAHVAQAHTSVAAFVPSMVVTGFGLSAVLGPVTAIVMREVGMERAGTASGVLNTSRQIGSLFGTAALGAVLQSRFSANFDELLGTSSLPAGDACGAAARESAARSLSVGLDLARDCPASTRDAVHHFAQRAFTAALEPATAVAAVVLLACAAACLWRLSRRSTRPSPTPAA